MTARTGPAGSAGRAAELIHLLDLQRHPEGGHYRELFRSAAVAAAPDGRGERAALTTIDFLLAPGEFSAWHRVRSDEVWHLMEGGPLRLWLVPPALDNPHAVELAPVDGTHRPRHVVPAGWWQAAEPLPGAYALSGATVAPGFDFADFAFGREDAAFRLALERLAPELRRLL